MRLGEIIKKYRDDNDLSVRDLEIKSGVSRSYISSLERGKHPTSGKSVHPSVEKIIMLAKAMDMSFEALFNMIDEYILLNEDNLPVESTSIPVLGRVAAGVPIDAIEDIIDHVDISRNMIEKGEFFALRIKGNSMEPSIFDGDTVIVQQAETASSKDIVIASVHGDDAVCKIYSKRGKKVVLKSINPDYDDIDVTDDTDFCIYGVVVELRRSFKKI